jgi:hypothetical protein
VPEVPTLEAERNNRSNQRDGMDLASLQWKSREDLSMEEGQGLAMVASIGQYELPADW